MQPSPIANSKFLSPDYLFNQAVAFLRKIYNFLGQNGAEIISIYHVALFILAVFFLAITFYAAIRTLEIRRKEKKHLEHEIQEYAHRQKEKEKEAKAGEEISKNPRWIKTLGYLFSQHASDWKLAVIEADTMLESLLDQLGFQGENLGEKLKSVKDTTFKSLPLAWEAHTIRNRIAHEGTFFELSQHEAKRVIAIYEQIFRQYGFI